MRPFGMTKTSRFFVSIALDIDMAVFAKNSMALFVAFVVAVPLFAQTELEKSKQASIVFDIEVSSLLNSPMASSLPILDMMRREGVLPPKDFVDLNALNRVYGAFQLPESMQVFEQMRPGDRLPFQMFLRAEFGKIEELDRIMKEIEANMEMVKKDGKDYFQFREESAPKNILVQRFDENTIEIGTESYLLRSDRNVATERLTKAWASLGEDSLIRLGFDLESSRDLVEQFWQLAAIESGSSDDETMILEEVTAFVGDVETCSIGFGGQGETMLSISVTGKDEQATNSVYESVNGLLYIARIAARVGIRQLQVDDPEAVAVLKTLAEQLRAKRNGNQVSINVRKPENFDRAMGKLIAEARRAAEITNKMNWFRQVGLSIHNYAEGYRRFPFEAYGDQQSADLSWRVRVLTFAEQFPLHEQFDLSKPWDNDTNKPLAQKMPELYGDDGKNSRVCWIRSDVKRFEDITDGSSQTIMLIENPDGVPWTQNKDLEIDDAVKLVKNLKDGQKIVVVMYDCSCRWIDNSADEKTLKAMMTPKGGEYIPYERQPGVDRNNRVGEDRPRPMRPVELKREEKKKERVEIDRN